MKFQQLIDGLSMLNGSKIELLNTNKGNFPAHEYEVVIKGKKYFVALREFQNDFVMILFFKDVNGEVVAFNWEDFKRNIESK